MRRALSLSLFLPVALGAQAPAAPAASARPLSEAAQIASAVQPLPAEFRADARVLGYREGRAGLVTLRAGSGAFVCLASDPAATRFHVACYHRSLEPFMARGRSLRASGVTGDQVDTVRFAEIRAGKLAMPSQPAALYSLTGPAGSYDAATNVVTGARALNVIYIAGATPASTGLSATPAQGTPWLMFPGTPKTRSSASSARSGGVRSGRTRARWPGSASAWRRPARRSSARSSRSPPREVRPRRWPAR